jgi:hypothetical protein
VTSWKTTDDTVVILPTMLDEIVLYAETGNHVKARQWLTELAAGVQVTDNPVGVAALLEAQGVVHAGEGKLRQTIEELRQAVQAWGKLKRGTARRACTKSAWRARRSTRAPLRAQGAGIPRHRNHRPQFWAGVDGVGPAVRNLVGDPLRVEAIEGSLRIQ